MIFNCLRQMLLVAFIVTGLPALASSECQVPLSPEDHYGWFQGEQGLWWLYPAAAGPVGLFHHATQRAYPLNAPADEPVTALVFEDRWRVSLEAPDCRISEGLVLTDLESGESERLTRAEQPYEVAATRFDSGDVELAALELIPKSPRAAIVIVHGSGSSDRDNGSYLAIADALARRGIAVMLPDKRGAGRSRGDWRSVGFEALAEDALSGLKALSSSVNYGEVPRGLLTVSQGGWVGPLAALKAPDEIDFVVNLVGPAVTLAQQQEHLLESMIETQGFDDSTAARLWATRDAALKFLEDDRDVNWVDYTEARSALLETPAAPLAQSFPQSRTDWNWAWGREVSHVDPIPMMERSDKPFLVIYGQDDPNVAVAPNTTKLVASEARVTLLVLPGRGHGLANPASGTIDSLVFETIHHWIASL